jgi:hypothetical protein
MVNPSLRHPHERLFIDKIFENCLEIDVQTIATWGTPQRRG